MFIPRGGLIRLPATNGRCAWWVICTFVRSARLRKNVGPLLSRVSPPQHPNWQLLERHGVLSGCWAAEALTGSKARPPPQRGAYLGEPATIYAKRQVWTQPSKEADQAPRGCHSALSFGRCAGRPLNALASGAEGGSKARGVGTSGAFGVGNVLSLEKPSSNSETLVAQDWFGTCWNWKMHVSPYGAKPIAKGRQNRQIQSKLQRLSYSCSMS